MKNMNLKRLYTVLPIALVAACGGGQDNNENIEEQTADTDLTTIQADTVNRRDAKGSSQGIDEDIVQRRNRELSRSGRNRFEINEQDDREIRSYDGSSNNVENPSWGANFSHLQRIGEANYTDGISAMAGDHRKSAREISNLVVAQSEGESIPNTYDTSDYIWTWGQFIDHDVGLNDGSTQEEENIIVPTGDVFFDPNSTGTAVIDFARAIYDPESGTSTENVREQENEISSWIDGSMVYGSDSERNMALREGYDSPFLLTSDNNLLPFNEAELINANGFIATPSELFLAGDVRVNEQAVLTAMHTIWVREHNRIATILQSRNPEINAEAIYEQTRRIVVGMIQHITYDEFLPALIGENTLPEYEGYDETINASTFNEFSAAAFRLGHSAVNDTLLRVDADGGQSEEGDLSLRNAFFAGHQLFIEEDDFDSLLRGLATQLHQKFDPQVVNGLRNFLFGNPGSGGFDLISLNIQRGRDHGLPTYNQTRVAMGLEPVQFFTDITDDTDLQMQLFNAYGTVDDIDLWVGGLSETPLVEQGSQLGELFTAINVLQFDSLRKGDRFWYQRYLTEDELQFVETTTLADVIRRNTSIGDELPNNVFYVE